jgi:hypothetical protein
MNLNEWRRQRAPVPETLPSGLSVQLKRVSMEDLALSGLIPAPLLNELSEKGQNGRVEIDSAEILANLADYSGLIDAIAAASVAMVQVGESEWLPVSDSNFDPAAELDQRDKLFIMNWSMAEVKALEPFRETNGAG